MSGYRSLHRECVAQDNTTASIPIWKIQTLLLSKTQWMIWTAQGNGTLQGYQVQDKADQDAMMDASAMKIIPKYKYIGTATQQLLGCTQISLIRNYVGDDDLAGDLIVASLNLVGTVQIYKIAEQHLLQDDEMQTQLTPTVSFQIKNSSGTTMALCPPKHNNHNNSNVLVALGCLDGSIHVVATGLAIPNSKREPLAPGTLVETLGSSSHNSTAKTSLVTCLVWHSTIPNLLGVGRQDGTVDLYLEGKRWHRIQQHHVKAVRGISFTNDQQLLMTGCDDGMICVWELHYNTTKSPTLVQHVVNAHDGGWILDMQCLEDNRRFVTCGTNDKIHVWTLSGQGSYAPLHTFDMDNDDSSDNDKNKNTPWTLHAVHSMDRLVVGTEKGWLQVFSLE